MAKKPNDNGENSPAAERDTAPVAVQSQNITNPYQPLQPWQMRATGGRGKGSPLVRHFPHVRGGICDKCGVLDKDTPSQYQYRLCEHYRGLALACNYCPSTVDPDEVVRSTVLSVTSHPYDPSQLVVVCDRYECVKAHQDKWNTTNQ